MKQMVAAEKNIKRMVPLIYRSNFWKTLEIHLINCEVNLILTFSEEPLIAFYSAASQAAQFAISDTKLFAPAVTLSTQDNAKLLKLLKSGFKRTVNWNK